MHGEKALFDGFRHKFHCFNHFRQNIKQYLQGHGVSSSDIVNIIDDIFGCQKGSDFLEGLVDSNSHDEFQQKLLVLKEHWKKLDDNDCFYDWFCQYKVSIVQETMLKFVREEAGLGCPPQPFTTNASQTTNFIFKNKLDYKSHQLLKFVEKLKQLIDDQEREIE